MLPTITNDILVNIKVKVNFQICRLNSDIGISTAFQPCVFAKIMCSSCINFSVPVVNIPKLLTTNIEDKI